MIKVKMNDIGGETVKDTDVYKLQDNKFGNNLTLSSTFLRAGKMTNGHAHTGQEEVYMFIDGEGEMTINEEQLMAMCQNMNKGPESAVKVLKMSLEDLNSRVNPAFWNNSNICFYRMNPIASLNDNLPKLTTNFLKFINMICKNYNYFIIEEKKI